MEVVGRTTQRLAAPNSSTYVGSGKCREIRRDMEALGVKTCLFDVELSPGQQRALEGEFGGEAVGIKVLDRTALILDIFAKHARTFEGRLQVELALYRYRLPRLTRMWKHLERQSGAGGVGLRGPGETQLEIDRRLIETKIQRLRREIEGVREHRARQRLARRRMQLPVIALVGYTNAGKSSLLNTLTDADVRAEDQLFATLDPTTRRAALPGLEVTPAVLLTDTVGFVQKLPTQLVAAFRATLEEVNEADILLHVVDVSNPNYPSQIKAVERVLGDIGAADKRQVIAWNKTDLLHEEDANRIALEAAGKPFTVAISTKTRFGLQDLVSVLEECIRDAMVPFEVLLPYSRGDIVARLHDKAVVDVEEYRPEGTYVSGQIHFHMAAPLAEYSCREEDSDTGSLSSSSESENDEIKMWKALAKNRRVD